MIDIGSEVRAIRKNEWGPAKGLDWFGACVLTTFASRGPSALASLRPRTGTQASQGAFLPHSFFLSDASERILLELVSDEVLGVSDVVRDSGAFDAGRPRNRLWPVVESDA